jgi:hypothetical protein
VRNQRQDKKKYEAGSKTAINDEKLQHLSDMDFQWSVKKERQDTVWNQRYEELRKFKDEHGHFRVTVKFSPKLEKWVWHHKSTGPRRTKNKERIAKLEAIGFFDA